MPSEHPVAATAGAPSPKAPPLPARRSDHVEVLHGETVPDPYRWLEDTWSEQTAAWVRAENELTGAWLAEVPGREAIRRRLTELFDHPRAGVPFERGGRWFQRRNSGLQDQPVLYVLDEPGASDGRVLLDPNTLSDDGTVSVPALEVSRDGSLLLYATSAAGSDWMTWKVRDVVSGHDLPDRVEWSKHGGASFLAGSTAFVYSAVERPEEGRELLASASQPRVMLHRLGTDQSEDQVLLDVSEHPEWLPHAVVSEDGAFLVVTISKGTAPEQRIELVPLGPDGPLGDTPERLVLVADFNCRAQLAGNVGRVVYLVTDDGAERRRLVAVDLDAPRAGTWRTVVAEGHDLLLAARVRGGRLVCHVLRDACSRLLVWSLDGERQQEVALPQICSLVEDPDAGFVSGDPQSEVVHFQLTSFADAGSLWSHDLARNETTQLRPSLAPVDPADYVSERVFVEASDGARVPMFLTRRVGVEPDGEVPVLLYGYGGFDIAVTPAFSRAAISFMERGGVYALAVLRGGGEYGRSWHDAGRLANKQRVFDDFCDCARFCVTSGWSRPERIAINGGSNGGLLVGACLTQHPELFGAAVPEVGVLDMLRFHRFTIGWAWKSDFGDPDDPEQYRWVRAYSPLHQVREGAAYPATLVMTADHDDRVVPGHSFKFAATLQAAQAETARRLGVTLPPVLVRIEGAAGHGAGTPVSKSIAGRTDMLAFLERALATS